MKVRIEADLSGHKSKIYEVDEKGAERLLQGIRGATINIGADEVSTIVMRIDLLTADIEGEMDASAKVINKDGELKDVVMIVYKDGTKDTYV